MALTASCLVVWGVGASAADKPEKKGDEIAWAKSLAAAKDQGRKDKKLIMVDFYTDWCGWCKKLDADTYTDPQVVKLSRDLVALKLDAEDKSEGQKAAAKYGVTGFPTILFLDPDQVDSKAGGVAGKIVGYAPPEPFANQVRTIALDFKDFPKLEERIKDSPDDVETLGRLIVIHHMRGNDTKAIDLMERARKADPENTKGYLTKAYNAVADVYQEKREIDKAIPLFRKVVETGKEPSDIAYGRVSLASCYFSQGDIDKAITELEAIPKIPGVSKGDKDQAEMMLKAARQAQKQQKDREKNKKDDKDK